VLEAVQQIVNDADLLAEVIARAEERPEVCRRPPMALGGGFVAGRRSRSGTGPSWSRYPAAARPRCTRWCGVQVPMSGLFGLAGTRLLDLAVPHAARIAPPPSTATSRRRHHEPSP
jgi:hypothetical protein